MAYLIRIVNREYHNYRAERPFGSLRGGLLRRSGAQIGCEEGARLFLCIPRRRLVVFEPVAERTPPMPYRSRAIRRTRSGAPAGGGESSSRQPVPRRESRRGRETGHQSSATEGRG